MSAKVTMTDIARRIGVSTVTVSKALSDKPGVSESMRERIAQMAEDMGYAKGRSRKGDDSYTVGVIVAARHLVDTNSFYWRVYQQISMEASDMECFTFLELVDIEKEEQGELPKLVTQKKAEGVIILGDFAREYRKVLAKKLSVPYIWLDSEGDRENGDCVLSDNLFGGAKMTEYLIRKGYQRIGFVGRLLATDSIIMRYLGYEKALIERGLPLKKAWVIDDRAEDGRMYEPEEYALPKDMPDAFFCNCDHAAQNFVRQLRAQGYAVPEDISVVGFDHHTDQPEFADFFTTYEIDVREMTRCALTMIRQKIEQADYYYGKVILRGKIVEGQSVRP